MYQLAKPSIVGAMPCARPLTGPKNDSINDLLGGNVPCARPLTEPIRPALLFANKAIKDLNGANHALTT
jgi:hypothetical protein